MSQLNEIGAVWKKTGQAGEYLTGSIQLNGRAYEIRIFNNKYKKQPKQPDMKVFLSTPEDQPAPQEPTINMGGSGGRDSRQITTPPPAYPEEDINPEDIPF